MGFKCGIVGLPNVGKSTLFNALTATMQAEAANYPFCTIEPNIGRVAVPDERLEQLAKIAGSAKIIPTQIEFVDIAGLVKGASKGEGLGNQFLSHIREVDAIINVLRCFEDEDISHVEGGVDPIRDLEIIEMELILADLESLEKRLPALEKKAKINDKHAIEQVNIIKQVIQCLNDGKPARKSNIENLEQLQIITSKPVMYVCNVKDHEITGNQHTQKVAAKLATEQIEHIIISSQIEAEISLLSSEEEKQQFLAAIGLEESGLSRLIKSGYELLNLISFFTIGPKEAHAWTIKKGTTARNSAGEIHTDFAKGFIRAETIAYSDYIKYKGEQGVKEAGKMHLEGKEYVTQDGDIFHFRFNV
jgi:GTP-binding protein YchF